MPFTSQKQRGLFFAAKGSPEVRARTGISQSVANKMTSEDTGGKLPTRAPKAPHLKHGGHIRGYAEGGHIPGASRGPTREELDPGVVEAAHGIDTERLRGYRRGGPPRVGEPVLVGERGPEIFVADRPGTVVPNHVAFGDNERYLRGMRRGGRVEPFAGEETEAEERAEGHELRGGGRGHQFHGGVHVHHHMANGGRIEAQPEAPSKGQFGGAPQRRGLATGALPGELPPQGNRMSALPGASSISARGPGPRGAAPEPKGRSTQAGPGKSKGGGKLATFGALKGLKRGASPNVRPRGNPPGPDRPNTRTMPHHVNPRGNPVGVGPHRNPPSPSAARQMR